MSRRVAAAIRPRSALLASLLALAGCALSAGPDRRPALTLAERAFAGADSLQVRTIETGVTLVRAWERAGPWAISVLEVDTARCRAVWQARKPPGPLAARATTTSLATGALAAVNADFFQLPGGTPVGPHVTGGRVLIGPGERPAWVWTGRALVSGSTRLSGTAVADGTDRVALVQVNRPARATSSYRPPSQGATLFTSLAAVVPPADSATDVVVLSLESGDEGAGTGRVRRVLRAPADTVVLAAGEAALQLHGADRAWAARRSVGGPVRWETRVLARAPDAEPAREALGGFPELLRAGADVLRDTEVIASFAGRHPRTAIGWSAAAGLVLLVTGDGRQAPYSDGMSLVELLALFRRLGASDALNLDGGGSTAMVVGGALQNRPSDREGERAVGNALALARCDRS